MEILYGANTCDAPDCCESPVVLLVAISALLGEGIRLSFACDRHREDRGQQLLERFSFEGRSRGWLLARPVAQVGEILTQDQIRLWATEEFFRLYRGILAGPVS